MVMYSYVIRIDDGAAPNPYYGYCTLAICKPKIRKNANYGDWVVATGNVELGNDKLVYAMKVTDVMDFNHYFDDERFEKKKPVFNGRESYAHLGDNIYKPEGREFKQQPSVHSRGKEEYLPNKEHDLGKNHENNRVLISDEFWYFGNRAVELPEELNSIIKAGQGHKSNSITEDVIKKFENFIKKFDKGIQGEPGLYISKDDIVQAKCRVEERCLED